MPQGKAKPSRSSVDQLLRRNGGACLRLYDKLLILATFYAIYTEHAGGKTSIMAQKP